jgi:hypothetical protein
MSGNGILYSCAGEESVGEALESARSSLRHNELPHLMFASAVPAGTNLEPGLSVERFEPSANPYMDKIANMRRSPFERTLYLDTDTYVTAEIGHVLRLLDRYEIAVAHEHRYRGLDDPEVPAAFYEFNTGVVAWRADERTEAFMRCWQETYARWLHDEPFARAADARGRADQPAFRHCVWEHQMRVAVLGPEYNFRLNVAGTAVDSVRILHGRHSKHEALAARLNRRRRPRSYSPFGRPPVLGLLRPPGSALRRAFRRG